MGGVQNAPRSRAEGSSSSDPSAVIGSSPVHARAEHTSAKLTRGLAAWCAWLLRIGSHRPCSSERAPWAVASPWTVPPQQARTSLWAAKRPKCSIFVLGFSNLYLKNG